MRRHYSSSAFIKWLRNKLDINKPYALPWGGFEKWEAELKAQRPIAYFFTEVLPEWFEKPAEWLIDPIHEGTYYIRNRFVTQTHVLRTGLEKGKWHELERRMLHGMFNELVDFVEIDQAWHHVVWDNEAKQKYKTPWWRSSSIFRFGEWRNADAGLDYLKWCMTLDDPEKDEHEQCISQAVGARETLVLYSWWKDVYLQRPEDAYNAVGVTEFSERMKEKYGDEATWPGLQKSPLTLDERAEQTKLYDSARTLEEDWVKEEEAMMIRLIKHRQSLWT